MKRIMIAVMAAVFLTAVFLGGCSSGKVNVNNTYVTMSEEQWAEYIDNLEESSSARLQAAINRSLLSGVTILSGFKYNYSHSGGLFGSINSTYTLFYTGAGVIVDIDRDSGDAYVVTNCHVVYSDTSANIFADEVYLYLYGQDIQGVNYNLYVQRLSGGYETYSVDDDGDYRIEAEVVGASLTYDIALLKVTGSEVLKNSDARAAQFCESDDVYVGQQVYAVGNPEGEGMAATSGVVSKDSGYISMSLSDSSTPLASSYIEYRVIRTDAAINGGNSGGGMYNSSGELVGIINSKSVSEEIDNMGYALPGSNVKRLWKLMRDTYEGGGYAFSKSTSGVTRAYLPAEYSALYTQAYLNSEGFAEITEIVSVTKVTGNSGLKTGDILTHIKISDADGNTVEDRQITRTYHIDDILLSARSGYKVTLTVLRGEGEVTVDVNCNFKKAA